MAARLASIGFAVLLVLAGVDCGDESDPCEGSTRPADPIRFCLDLRLVQDRLAWVCELPPLESEERSCEGFHFSPECTSTACHADRCLDALWELRASECGGATDVREIDVLECGSCPGEDG